MCRNWGLRKVGQAVERGESKGAREREMSCPKERSGVFMPRKLIRGQRYRTAFHARTTRIRKEQIVEFEPKHRTDHITVISTGDSRDQVCLRPAQEAVILGLLSQKRTPFQPNLFTWPVFFFFFFLSSFCSSVFGINKTHFMVNARVASDERWGGEEIQFGEVAMISRSDFSPLMDENS